MGAMASEISSLTIVYSTFIQAQVKENINAPRHWPLCGEFTVTDHRWPVNSPHKGPVTRKRFPFDDVIMDRRDIARFRSILTVSRNKHNRAYFHFENQHIKLLFRIHNDKKNHNLRQRKSRLYKLYSYSFFYIKDTSSRFYLHGFTLIPAWINNNMLGKVWDEINYPFLNFNGATVEV